MSTQITVGPITISDHKGHYEKTDDRRNKIYQVTVSTAWRLGFDDDERNQFGKRPLPLNSICERLRVDVQPMYPAGCTFTGSGYEVAVQRCKVDHGGTYSSRFYRARACDTKQPHGYMAIVSVKITASATRPGLLPDEETARAWFNNDNVQLRSMLAAAIDHELAVQDETELCKELSHQATHCAGWYLEELTKKASRRCRYKQRLAALNAELEEEKKEQARKARKQIKREGFKIGKQDAAPEIVQAVLAILDNPDNIKGRGTRRGFLPLSSCSSPLVSEDMISEIRSQLAAESEDDAQD